MIWPGDTRPLWQQALEARGDARYAINVISIDRYKHRNWIPTEKGWNHPYAKDMIPIGGRGNVFLTKQQLDYFLKK